MFRLQLAGVTAATLNNQTVKSKIVSTFATHFNVLPSQINITVIATPASSSTSSQRHLDTGSVTLLVTITNLNSEQASTVNGIIYSTAAVTTLQGYIASSSPALAGVKVSALSLTSTSKPTLHPTTKPIPTSALAPAPAPTKSSGASFKIQVVQGVILLVSCVASGLLNF